MFSRVYLTTILKDDEKSLHHVHVAKIYRTILLFINIIIQPIYIFLVIYLLFVYKKDGLLLLSLPSLISFPIFYYYLSMIFTEYLITDKRLLVKKGIIARNVKEMNLNSVETVTVDQGIIDRVLQTGTIIISGRGTEGIVFKDIDEPSSIREKVETTL